LGDKKRKATLSSVDSNRIATVIALVLCVYIFLDLLCQGCIGQAINSFIYTVSRLYWAGN
jgi:hypothetical protein